MSKYSEQILTDIKLRADIVGIISRYIPLKKAGKYFKACCPFHHEKTPSFVVTPDKQIFHCFGCGAGGDVFAFIMQYERLTFPEAVRQLAEQTGVSLEEYHHAGGSEPSLVAELHRVMELACAFFELQLRNSPAGQQARDYCASRNLLPETLSLFRVGYARDEWQALWRYLAQQQISEALRQKSGLFVCSESGRWYDRFRNRLVFPIFNIQGRIIAFGGRTIAPAQPAQPKYLNSPETVLYQKGSHLFGMHAARAAIAEHDAVIIVEGYFDCIIPVQAGIGNIVASLGTAFTAEHARLLQRYTRNVTLVFDGDRAGESAAARGMDILIDEGMQVRVACLPPGTDPDTCVRDYGPERFSAEVAAAQNFYEFFLTRFSRHYDVNQPEGKAAIARAMLEQIVRLRQPLIQAVYIGQLSHSLDMPETVLRQQARLVQHGNVPAVCGGITRATSTASNQRQASTLLIALLLEQPQILATLPLSLTPEEISEPLAKAALQCLLTAFSQRGEQFQAAEVLAYAADPELHKFFCTVLTHDYGIVDAQRAFADCVRKIKIDNIRRRLCTLQRQLRQQDVSDPVVTQQVLDEFVSLKKEQLYYEQSGNEENSKKISGAADAH